MDEFELGTEETSQLESKQQRLRYEIPDPGSTGPAGFEPQPSKEHIDQAQKALERIATAVTEDETVDRPRLDLTLCHFHLDPLLARNLFGFIIHDFDEEGDWIDPIGARSVRYAIALNQSVELQQEIALVFIHSLAHRQARQQEMRHKGESVQRIDLEMQSEDSRARKEISDRLRYGWAAAAQTVRSRMRQAGFRISVRYEPDTIPNREMLQRRLPKLRSLYNEFEPIRDSVDRMVSSIGGDDPRLSIRGAPRAARDLGQRMTRISRLRHYINQATRDAEVYGNGYLAISKVEPIGAYNLPPDVVLLEDGRYRVEGQRIQEFPADAITHARGSKQLRSGYGVSVLEPFLPTLQNVEVFGKAKQFADELLRSGAPDDQRQWAESVRKQATRVQQEGQERLRQILWFPLEHMPSPTSNLYFSGFEDL